jgi:8-amino-7-oxononanoate synthase
MGPSHAARPQPGTWLASWLEACAELDRLQAGNPMVDAVIDEVDGRRLRIGDRWLHDFASCNYLGLDLDREVIEGIPAYLERWGTHPGWSRMLGSLAVYEELEAELRELLGVEDVLLLPTLTHIHAAAIPVLAGGGTVLLDARAHKTIHDGAVVARARGAGLRRFAHDDPADLERLLAERPPAPRLICLDGVNSMTGNPPRLAELADLAEAYGATLYIDDGHGFGVVGERDREEASPYGRRGNGVVRHLGQAYDRIVFTAGFSKAYSSLLAFIACPTPIKRLLKITAPPYLYSGPSPVASLASAQLGLRVNASRGDELRAMLYGKTRRVLDHLEKLGAATLNTSSFPIIEVPLADADDLDRVGRLLFERGMYTTLAFYPGVPRNEVGFRLQLTAIHTADQVDELLVVLDELADRGVLRTGALA